MLAAEFAANHVSIRAPARGATRCLPFPAVRDGFQFALPRGERLRSTSSGQRWRRFNSRSREGSDAGQQQLIFDAAVSIRAPARGATNCRSVVGSVMPFQFALPRGERLPLTAGHAREEEFQFALPRGEQRRGQGQCVARRQFQFALPRGERRPPTYG